MTVLSVHSFDITSPGGGPRILRALFSQAPERVVNVCLSAQPPATQSRFEQHHLPTRPAFGRLESTRLGAWLDVLVPARSRSIGKELVDLARAYDATCVHTVAHSLEFWPALHAARELGVPYYLSAHDHVGYALQGNPLRRLALRRLRDAWRSANHRFAISEELGRAYNFRYGDRSFTVVTDGIDETPLPYEPPPAWSLRLYFAGAFHLAYADNLRALLAGLERLAGISHVRPTFTCRCGSLSDHALETTLPITVLPFADEETVSADLRSADLFYLPLPFGDRHADLRRFSLPTKLITYLGGGRPIVYHGPRDSTVCTLLAKHRAAIVLPSQDPAVIADELNAGLARSENIVENARELARRGFTLEAQRRRFWATVGHPA